jgi:hypothetical protein
MQWSRIRTRLLSLLTPQLSGRVDFHLTSYRPSGHNHEVWITVDKKRVFTASYCRNQIEENVLQWETGLRIWAEGEEGKKALDVLTANEIHDAGDVVSTFRTYLDLDPKVALTSTDPILKALAIGDRRIGVRSLQRLKLKEDEHSLVRIFHKLRLNGIESSKIVH